jgi:hypothetical protein
MESVKSLFIILQRTGTMFGLPVVFNGGGGGLYSYMLGITADLQQCHDLSGTRFLTASGSSPWLAILTMGEGWHNNHHYCAYTARQSFVW